MTVIDTPDGIAFFRALARKGAMAEKRPGIFKIVKEVYGYPGGPKAVEQMHKEYIDGTLELRSWTQERGLRAGKIAQEAINRAAEENDAYTKDDIDSNIQALFEAGAITEQEGNDACLLVFVEVIRAHAGSR